MIERLQKARALHAYRGTLGSALKQAYGWKRYYSPVQVDAAIASSGCPRTYIAYAYALYCRRSEFDAVHSHRDGKDTYERLRTEVVGVRGRGNCSDGGFVYYSGSDDSESEGFFARLLKGQNGAGDTGTGGDVSGEGGGGGGE